MGHYVVFSKRPDWRIQQAECLKWKEELETFQTNLEAINNNTLNPHTNIDINRINDGVNPLIYSSSCLDIHELNTTKNKINTAFVALNAKSNAFATAEALSEDELTTLRNELAFINRQIKDLDKKKCHLRECLIVQRDEIMENYKTLRTQTLRKGFAKNLNDLKQKITTYVNDL